MELQWLTFVITAFTAWELVLPQNRQNLIKSHTLALEFQIFSSYYGLKILVILSPYRYSSSSHWSFYHTIQQSNLYGIHLFQFLNKEKNIDFYLKTVFI